MSISSKGMAGHWCDLFHAFHFAEMNMFNVPLLVSKGIDFTFQGARTQMEDSDLPFSAKQGSSVRSNPQLAGSVLVRLVSGDEDVAAVRILQVGSRAV